MKQVKAFVHRGRVADIVHGLRESGYTRIGLVDVKGLLHALSAREQAYSVELGEQVTPEIQIELYCEDDQVEAAVALMQQHGRTGRRDAGWIYVSPVEASFPVDPRD